MIILYAYEQVQEKYNMLHILIIDDDKKILNLLSEILTKKGIFITNTTSSSEALDLIKILDFDIIIADIMMPNITGIEFTNEVRKASIDTPIIFLTALDDNETKEKALSAAGNLSSYIVKPFEVEDLLAQIETLAPKNKPSHKIFQIDNFLYDANSRALFYNYYLQVLTMESRHMLEYLINNPKQPYSLKELGIACNYDEEISDIAIKALAKVLNQDKEILKLRKGKYVLST